MIVDRASSHILDKSQLKNFDDDGRCHIFVGKYHYTNLDVAYFPPNLTATLQPLDQAYFAVVKTQYRSWFNNQLAIEASPKKFEKVQKIAEILKNISTEVIQSCWSKTRNAIDPEVPAIMPESITVSSENSSSEEEFVELVPIESEPIQARTENTIPMQVKTLKQVSIKRFLK